MIRVNQVKIPIAQHPTDRDALEEIWRKHLCQMLRVRSQDILHIEPIRRSIDARRKEELSYSYSLSVQVKSEAKLLSRLAKNPNVGEDKREHYPLPRPLLHFFEEEKHLRPVVVGTGPAGIFAAYLLSLAGAKPIILERGKQVEDRLLDVEHFWKTGELDPNSNVQFGEGGAGTFSDGKLNTQVKDRLGRNAFVLKTFVECGAPEDILIDAKPHIGTDILVTVMRHLRQKLLDLGADFRFERQMIEPIIEGGQICGLKVLDLRQGKEEILPCDKLILAIGHSARDSFEHLYQREVPMEAKSFAVGFRMEHPQRRINLSQYKRLDLALPAAPYKLAKTFGNGRGVYSFCMCPGGYVVNASSEKGRLAVNGMSYADRGSDNANSAIILTVGAEEFDMSHPLSGMAFQRQLEERAYALGKGKIPQQLWGDFVKNQSSHGPGSFASCQKGQACWSNLRGLLPARLEELLQEAMSFFGRRIQGFDDDDVILSAVESRTSSPVRIPRGDDFQSQIRGLYPCGEGAGYAGGITSAAMDGLKVAEAVIEHLRSES